MPHRRELAERFEEKVDRSPGHGPWGDCHLWTGKPNPNGYGSIRRGRADEGQPGSHVAAWELVHSSVPTGMCVCHTCDVKLCVNEEHLFLGTQAENNEDCRQKDRHARAERHGSAKLNAEQVQHIRLQRGVKSQRVLAAEYGVDQTLISQIQRKQIWREAA